MGTGFSKKKKEARAMQEQFSKMQSELSKTEVVGVAGNGLVTITLTGDGDMKDLKIKPECVDPEDVEGLQLLIKAAHVDAQKKMKDKSPTMPGMPDLSSLLGGLR
jgi:nucleoid-associated protein EbfC